jgi:hypothetical protein
MLREGLVIEVPDYQRLRRLTDKEGRVTQEGWAEIDRLIRAIRELQETAADHETRITTLEPP